ncbi:MAG: virulence protein RhuM/Fic/DOC family protein [Candidatus Doudnabacteria bacterium]|nr:virulence protein RhuM/Fic/DOC family protein [Candidatus Doudnabacteria bacterium]
MDTNKKQFKGEIIIYKAAEGPEIQVKFEDDSVWLSQAQIAELFGTKRPAITKHLKNIFKAAELSENSVCSILEHTASDGKIYKTQYYNLDAIIAVGYRINSKRATQFRIWATQKLRDYLLKGFVINEKRLPEAHIAKLKELETAHKLIQQVLESKRSEGYERELLRIISDYANTWFILNLYDEQKLAIENVSERKSQGLVYEEVIENIARFRARLKTQKQATDLFGVEVSHKLSSILGSIQQSFGGKSLYKSLEEKAANLLYLVIKDHPFVDGNKRIGSLLFLLYLIENRLFYNRRGERKINDTALVALALLIAESKPQQKEAMVKLVVNLINKK